MLHIVVTPNTRPTPAGKLADVAVHFTAGPLAGTKLVGFAVWESQWPDKRTGAFVRVTVPSREYADANGQAKRYDLLRPIADVARGQASPLDALRGAILQAFEAHHAQVEQATAVGRQVAQVARVAQPAPARRAPAAPPVAPPTRRYAAPMPTPVAPPQRRAAAAGGRQEPPPPTDDDNYPF